jgi:hypothetical protein
MKLTHKSLYIFFFQPSYTPNPASTSCDQVATWIHFFSPGHNQWELLGRALFIPYYRPQDSLVMTRIILP